MKSKISTIIMIVVLLAGLSLLLYPSFADYWNSLHASYAVQNYKEQLALLDAEAIDAAWNEAYAYNEQMKQRGSYYELSADLREQYETVLNIGGTGIIGYIDYPAIDATYPINHGTSEAILTMAIGHLDWTFFPIDSGSSHAAISGHRGLPTAKLFTNLDRAEIGDLFTIEILDTTFTYEVDQIEVVLPSDLTYLVTKNDPADYLTLITCTPYGVNSHRMLVRAHRVDDVSKLSRIRVTSEAALIEPIIIAPMLAIPMLLALLIVIMVQDHRRKKHNEVKPESDLWEETYDEYT